MMKSTLVLLLTLSSLLTLSLRFADARPVQDDNAQQAEVLQKWLEFMTPGAEHEMLKQREGKWNVRIEMWTAPDAESMISEGTMEARLVMGGRYLMDTMQSKFQGQDFEGRSITGYDKLKKKFVSVWIDNLGTGFTISTGEYDAATKTFSYATMSPDVELGEYKRTRTVERVISQDEWVTEMYDTAADGKEFLMMKALYKRGNE